MSARSRIQNPASQKSSLLTLHLLASAVSLVLAGLNSLFAAPASVPHQTLTLPPNVSRPLFNDIDGDGLADLLAIDPLGRKLFIFRQRPTGFTNSPHQVIALPPQTAWVAACDVDPHPGLELLFSTANGLLFSRQEASRVESELHLLINATQVFTNIDFPVLISLTASPQKTASTNLAIPVISSSQAVLYRRDSDYHWSPEPPLNLQTKLTDWSADHELRRDPWALGPNGAHRLLVEQSFRAKPDPKRDKTSENAVIEKIFADMKTNVMAGPPVMSRVDIDGDGREDLVLWQVAGKLDDVKTDLYVFLRGTDLKLPEQPSQVLHCRGFPIPIGSTGEWTPICDLDGDNRCELVLLDFKTVFSNPSALLKTVLSRGVDFSLNIRSFRGGAFSAGPDASFVLTALLPSEVLNGWPLFIYGDFNGDGRPDFLVRRSESQWSIYMSTTDGRWFAPQPALNFETPPQGYIEIVDLNGDGLADIVWHEPHDARLTMFWTPARPGEGRKP